MVRLPIMTLFLGGQASSPITSAPSQIAAGQITKALKMWNPEIWKCFLEFAGQAGKATGISGVQVQKGRFQELRFMKFTCFNSVTRRYCHVANESAKISSHIPNIPVKVQIFSEFTFSSSGDESTILGGGAVTHRQQQSAAAAVPRNLADNLFQVLAAFLPPDLLLIRSF